jgi:hypothetical protein
MNDDDVMRCASDGEDSGNLEEIHPVQKKSLIHESLKTFAGVAGNVLEVSPFLFHGSVINNESFSEITFLFRFLQWYGKLRKAIVSFFGIYI